MTKQEKNKMVKCKSCQYMIESQAETLRDMALNLNDYTKLKRYLDSEAVKIKKEDCPHKVNP